MILVDKHFSMINCTIKYFMTVSNSNLNSIFPKHKSATRELSLNFDVGKNGNFIRDLEDSNCLDIDHHLISSSYPYYHVLFPFTCIIEFSKFKILKKSYLYIYISLNNRGMNLFCIMNLYMLGLSNFFQVIHDCTFISLLGVTCTFDLQT